MSCAKEKSYEHGIDENPNYETSWQFKDTSVTFGGNATSYALDSTGMEMEYEGTTADGLGEIRIKLNSLSGILKQGTYKSEKGEVEFSYSSGGAPRYEADLLDSIGEKLTVTILSIDSMSVIGFFTGTARTPSDTVISITEGKFNYRKVVIPTVDSAQGSLGTDADTCTGAAIAGTYKKGLSLTSANTVAVNVNVTKVGFYTIGTDTLKGIYFNKSGIFTSLGVQTVVLNGIGTPLDSGLTVFKVKYGTSVCGFDINIDTSSITPPITDFYFQFNDTTDLYYSNTVISSFSNTASTGYYLLLEARTPSLDTSFSIGIQSAIPLVTGVEYKTSSNPIAATFAVEDTDPRKIYYSDYTKTGTDIVFKFDLIDTTNKIVSGTFSGIALQRDSALRTISAGKFRTDY